MHHCENKHYLKPPHCPKRSASVLRALPVGWLSCGRQVPWDCAAAPAPAGGTAVFGLAGRMVELMSCAAAVGMSNSSSTGMCSMSSSSVSVMINAAGCRCTTFNTTCQPRVPAESPIRGHADHRSASPNKGLCLGQQTPSHCRPAAFCKWSPLPVCHSHTVKQTAPAITAQHASETYSFALLSPGSLIRAKLSLPLLGKGIL